MLFYPESAHFTWFQQPNTHLCILQLQSVPCDLFSTYSYMYKRAVTQRESQVLAMQPKCPVCGIYL